MTKQLVKIGLAIMTTLLGLVIIWQFRTVVLYILISLMLAAALHPFVERLNGRKVVVRIIWILVYVTALAGLGFLLFFTAGSAVAEIQTLAESISTQNVWMLPVWLQGSSFQSTVMAWLPPPSSLLEAITGAQGQFVLPAIISFTQGIGVVVSGIIVIVFLSIYWSINQVHFKRLWLSLLPSGQRKKARGIWRTIEPDIGAYIRGQGIQSLLAGLLLGLGFYLLGSPYPAFLGLVGAVACLIPMIGGALAVIPVFLVGLMTSVPLALITTFYSLVILVALKILVKPRLFNRRWENFTLTLVLFIAFSTAFGLIGLIIAPPVSVICQILWNRLVSRPSVSGAAERVLDLKERQERLSETIRAMDEPPVPLITSSMERLTNLIKKAEPILEEVMQVNTSEPVSLGAVNNKSRGN